LAELKKAAYQVEMVCYQTDRSNRGDTPP